MEKKKPVGEKRAADSGWRSQVSVGGNARLHTERAETDCYQLHTLISFNVSHATVLTVAFICISDVCTMTKTSSRSAIVSIMGNYLGNKGHPWKYPQCKINVDVTVCCIDEKL